MFFFYFFNAKPRRKYFLFRGIFLCPRVAAYQSSFSQENNHNWHFHFVLFEPEFIAVPISISSFKIYLSKMKVCLYFLIQKFTNQFSLKIIKFERIKYKFVFAVGNLIFAIYRTVFVFFLFSRILHFFAFFSQI